MLNIDVIHCKSVGIIYSETRQLPDLFCNISGFRSHRTLANFSSLFLLFKPKGFQLKFTFSKQI